MQKGRGFVFAGARDTARCPSSCPQRTNGGDAGNRTRVHYFEPQSSTGVAYESVLLGPALCHKHLARQAQLQRSNWRGYSALKLAETQRLIISFSKGEIWKNPLTLLKE